MPESSTRHRVRQVALALVLLIPGTPQILSQDYAIDSLLDFARGSVRTDRAADTVEQYGAPPDDERALQQSPPTPSGAKPPYPLNHVFDGEVVDVSNPPANHDFSAEPFTVGTPPSNHDFETAPTTVGTPPTNHDFETGDLTGWTTSGTVTIQSDATHGSWAKLTGSGATVISDAFMVDNAAQTFTIDIGFLTTSGTSLVKVYVLSGAGYATQTEIGDLSCASCGSWQPRSFGAAPWLGQSVKLKVVRTGGEIGVDAVRMEELLPGYSLAGSLARVTEGSNHLVRLSGNGTQVTTAAFTVDSAAQIGRLQLRGVGVNAQYRIYVLSGAGYGTATQVALGSATTGVWTPLNISFTAWQGQSIKLRIERNLGTVEFDDVAVAWVPAPEWTLSSGGYIRRDVENGNPYLWINAGSVTSQPFTLDEAAQQLTLRYRAGSTSGLVYVELLHGQNFSQVLDLAIGPLSTSDQINWQTFTAGIQDFAGQTVKLRLRKYFGAIHLDDLALTESLLPGWEVYGTAPAIAVGDDEHGSYVTSNPTGNGYLPSFR